MRKLVNQSFNSSFKVFIRFGIAINSMHNCVQPDMVKTFPFFLCQIFQQKQPIKELLKPSRVDNLGKILSGDGIYSSKKNSYLKNCLAKRWQNDKKLGINAKIGKVLENTENISKNGPQNFLQKKLVTTYAQLF